MKNMNNIIEVIKTNKKAIMKKALIVGGTGIGLAIVANLVRPKTDEDELDDNLEVVDLDEEIQEVSEETQEEI